MISKKTRAGLIAQLQAHGTLAGAAPPHTISKAEASEERTIVVAALMRRQRDAVGSRWLAPTADLTVLP